MIKMGDIKTFVGSFVTPFHQKRKRMIFNHNFPCFHLRHIAISFLELLYLFPVAFLLCGYDAFGTYDVYTGAIHAQML